MSSSEWSVIKTFVLERAESTCEDCGAQEPLEVHHKTYRNFGGKEQLSDLIAVCKNCHESRDRLHREAHGNRSTGRARWLSPSEMQAVAQALTDQPEKRGLTTHCYRCGGSLNTETHAACVACKWLVCDCGVCGCGWAP